MRANGQVPTGRARRKRCASYTRKSTEEGLEQDFNSLDAQRETGGLPPLGYDNRDKKLVVSLRPHHANKQGRRYHYYVSGRLLAEPGNPDPSGWRLPVKQLDQAVLGVVTRWLEDRQGLESLLLSPDARIAERNKLNAAARQLVDQHRQGGGDPAPIVERIDLASTEIRITLDRHHLSEALTLSVTDFTDTQDIVINEPITLKRRGVEARLVIGGNSAPDAKLIAAIAAARHWFNDLQSGKASSVLELAARHNIDRSHISRTLSLAFLAPDIVTAIIDGRTDASLTLSYIKRLKLPASWQVQRDLLRIQ